MTGGLAPGRLLPSRVDRSILRSESLPGRPEGRPSFSPDSSSALNVPVQAVRSLGPNTSPQPAIGDAATTKPQRYGCSFPPHRLDAVALGLLRGDPMMTIRPLQTSNRLWCWAKWFHSSSRVDVRARRNYVASGSAASATNVYAFKGQGKADDSARVEEPVGW